MIIKKHMNCNVCFKRYYLDTRVLYLIHKGNLTNLVKAFQHPYKNLTKGRWWWWGGGGGNPESG